jgi:hypothetical protein
MTARPYGTTLWFIITSVVLFLGIRISRYRAPDISVRRKTNNVMDIVFKIAEIEEKEVNIFFRRPLEEELIIKKGNSIFISFYSPRVEIPYSNGNNQFWIAIERRLGLIEMITAVLKTIQYEIPSSEKDIHLHFGWPLSSWIDRMSIGIMIHNIIKLPRKFPNFYFHMDYQINRKSAE